MEQVTNDNNVNNPNNTGNKKNKKPIVIAVAAAAVVGLGAVAYTTGLLPFGGANKAASELKAQIEGMKGPAFGQQYNAFIKKAFKLDELITDPKQKQEFDAVLAQSTNMSLSYDALKTRTDGSKGIVDITNPVIKAETPVLPEAASASPNPFAGMFAGGITYKYKNVSVAREADDKNHYYLNMTGGYEMFMGEQKLVGYQSAGDDVEIKLAEVGGVDLLKWNSKNPSISEGRGNTVLLKALTSNGEYAYNPADSKTSVKLNMEHVEFGDMVKMMVGAIEPINFKVDADYKGKSIFAAVQEQQAHTQALLTADPTATPPAAPEFKADVVVNNFELKMGNSGLVASGNVNIDQKESVATPPNLTGNLKVTFAEYQKLFTYLSTSFPVPPAELAKATAFLNEIGTAQGNDLTFAINIQNQSYTINGKTEQEVAVIHAKYFANVASVEGDESGLPAPAPVDAQPLAPVSAAPTSPAKLEPSAK